MPGKGGINLWKIASAYGIHAFICLCVTMAVLLYVKVIGVWSGLIFIHFFYTEIYDSVFRLAVVIYDAVHFIVEIHVAHVF